MLGLVPAIDQQIVDKCGDEFIETVQYDRIHKALELIDDVFDSLHQQGNVPGHVTQDQPME